MVGKTGQTKRHSGFCVLLLTPPTKFCRKPEKLNLNLIEIVKYLTLQKNICIILLKRTSMFFLKI